MKPAQQRAAQRAGPLAPAPGMAAPASLTLPGAERYDRLRTAISPERSDDLGQVNRRVDPGRRTPLPGSRVTGWADGGRAWL